MKFTDKLDLLMKENNLNRRTFAMKCDIPYTTVCGWYDKGYDGVRMNTVRKIASTFNTGLEYWAYDELPEDTEKAPETEVPEAKEKSSIVAALTNMLQSAGWLREDGDISDEDRRFLRSVAAMLDAYFEEQR